MTIRRFTPINCLKITNSNNILFPVHVFDFNQHVGLVMQDIRKYEDRKSIEFRDFNFIVNFVPVESCRELPWSEKAQEEFKVQDYEKFIGLNALWTKPEYDTSGYFYTKTKEEAEIVMDEFLNLRTLYHNNTIETKSYIMMFRGVLKINLEYNPCVREKVVDKDKKQ